MRSIKKGATSQSVYFDLLDSTSTTGGRKTGLVYNTSSLTAYYVRNQGSATAITLATLAAANSAFSSGGFKEVDATNMPGVYRLDVPDAALAAGSGDSVVVTLKGATGLAQASLEIALVAWDPQDSVRAGLTALPNAAAEAAGGLYTRGSGAGQITQDANGRIDANAKAWAGTATTLTGGLPDVNMKTITAGIIAAASFAANALDAVWSTATRVLTAGTNIVLAKGTGVTGFNDLTAAAIATGVWQDATAGDFTVSSSIGKSLYTSGNAPGAASGLALVGSNMGSITGALTGAQIATAVWQDTTAGDFTVALSIGKSVLNGVTLGTGLTINGYTGNTPQTGDGFARLGAPAGASHAADVAAVKTDTAAVKTQTDKFVFTIANQVDCNVLDWKSATAPAMTGDAYARLGAPAGASHAADVAAVKSDTAAIASLPTANANADALLDRSAGVETSWTMRQAMRIMLSALAGKASGLAGTSVAYRDMADSKNRIAATVDSNGNRTAVTLDAS